jgi:hypothetical protein
MKMMWRNITRMLPRVTCPERKGSQIVVFEQCNNRFQFLKPRNTRSATQTLIAEVNAIGLTHKSHSATLPLLTNPDPPKFGVIVEKKDLAETP